jgi:hypothetical protein
VVVIDLVERRRLTRPRAQLKTDARLVTIVYLAVGVLDAALLWSYAASSIGCHPAPRSICCTFRFIRSM